MDSEFGLCCVIKGFNGLAPLEEVDSRYFLGTVIAKVESSILNMHKIDTRGLKAVHWMIAHDL